MYLFKTDAEAKLEGGEEKGDSSSDEDDDEAADDGDEDSGDDERGEGKEASSEEDETEDTPAVSNQIYRDSSFLRFLHVHLIKGTTLTIFLSPYLVTAG